MFRFIAVLTVTAAVATGAAPASGQQMQPPAREERPYRGLFGGGVGNAEQVLTVNFSAGGGYDDNVLASSTGPALSGAPPSNASGGGFGALGGGLSYSLGRKRVGFNASVASNARFYPSYDEFVGSHSVSGGGFVQIAKSTRLVASHTSNYQPYLTLGVFPPLFDVPGQAIPPSIDLGVVRSPYFSHWSTVSLTQGLPGRQSISAGYAYRKEDFEATDADVGRRDLTDHSVNGRWSFGLTKGLTAYAGYGYSGARYHGDNSNPVAGHNIDAGVSFDKALSFSRRTTLSFGTGSTFVSHRDRTEYRLTGRANLSREIGRTWNASVGYARDVQYVEAFPEPVFTDGISLAYGGMINRRLQFHSTASAAIGQLAFTAEGGGMDTYVGTAGLTYALNRYLGLGVDYVYYRYSFEQGVPLPRGYSREMSRNSVQADLTVWLPIFHRARRPDAAR